MSKIFVSIACFMDNDIVNTIEDCLRKAKYPDNLVFGICLQSEEDDNCLDNYKHNKQFIIKHINWSEARGPAYARGIIYDMFSDEDYFFQIDCHTRFFDNWDENIINCFNECKKINNKAIISHYPVNINDMGKKNNTIVNISTVRCIDINMGIKTHGRHVNVTSCPTKSWGISAAMLFFDKIAHRDIPFDKDIYFGLQFEEQVVLAARYWTNGYDIFTPNKHIIATEYLTNINRQKKKVPRISKLQKETYDRLCHIMKLKYNSKYDDTQNSRLGNERTIEDYYKMLQIYNKVKETYPDNYLQDSQNINNMFDIVISINVHEKVDFLLEQLDNIHYFTNHLSVCVIYNCNNFMLQELYKQNFKSYKNLKIIINPESIEKKRWHGSLCKGIIKNMEYVINNNIKFREFIVLSSRNILQSKLDLVFIEENHKFYYDNIIKLTRDNRRFYFNKHNKFYICDGSTQDYWHVDMTSTRFWFWGKIKNTDWFKKLEKQVDFFIGGRHEGLCISYEIIIKIVDFCKNNNAILNSCYQFNIALEEVIPQVLACKFKTDNKMYCLLESPLIIKIERNIEHIRREKNKWRK